MSKTMTTVPRPRPKRLKRSWTALRRIWRKKHETTIGQIVTTALVLAVAGWFIIAAINRVSHRQDYETARRLYDRQVEEHDACLDLAKTRVENRDVLRGQLIAVVENGAERSIHQAEGLRAAVLAIIPDSEQAKTAMDNYVQLATTAADDATELAHASQDADYPSLDLVMEQAKCVPPGPEPTPSG